MDEETQVNMWKPAKRPLPEQVKSAVVWIAVVAMAVGVVMLLIALNQVVVVWFQYQYVPFARMAMGIGIIGAAVAVIWRLTGQKRAE